MKCDVLIIGGGPAGLWAAKRSADLGLDAVVLEEHLAIGLPKHCSGWLMGCEFTNELIPQLKFAMPHKRVNRMIVREPRSGEVKEDIEDTGWGGYLIHRDLFERELARLTVSAGAKLFLGTRADELVKEDGQVVGARTSSKHLPLVRAAVTICADGKTSATARGFARREIASAEEAETHPGLLMELVHVKGVKAGEIEIYEPDDASARRCSLWPHPGVTITTFNSLSDFYEVKSQGGDIFSSKLVSSFPIYINSFQNRRKMGYFYSCLAKDGVIFVGEASGCSGIVHGMISGHYGALAAKKAVQEKDATTRTLSEYEETIKDSDIYRTPFTYRHIRRQYGSWREWVERSREMKVKVG